jgi:hypothetical protein
MRSESNLNETEAEVYRRRLVARMALEKAGMKEDERTRQLSTYFNAGGFLFILHHPLHHHIIASLHLCHNPTHHILVRKIILLFLISIPEISIQFRCSEVWSLDE